MEAADQRVYFVDPGDLPHTPQRVICHASAKDRVMPATWAETGCEPLAASATLCEISCVALRCCSTVAAMPLINASI
jgi:hypothetical protein